MADHPGPQRRYTEKEMSRIFQQALERQEEARARGDGRTGSGWSLEEMEQIATEVGIESEHLRAAAEGLQTSTESHEDFHWLGGPHRFALGLTVDGDLAEHAWEDLVFSLQRSLGSGEQSQTGALLEWTCHESAYRTQFKAKPRPNGTRIELISEWSSMAFPFFMPALVLSLISLPILGEAPLAPFLKVLLIPAWWATAFLLARQAFGFWARHRQRTLGGLMDELVELASQGDATDSSSVTEQHLTGEQHDEQQAKQPLSSS